MGSWAFYKGSIVMTGNPKGRGTQGWAGMWAWLCKGIRTDGEGTGQEGSSKGNSRSKGPEAGQRVKCLRTAVMHEAGYVQGKKLSKPRLHQQCSDWPQK